MHTIFRTPALIRHITTRGPVRRCLVACVCIGLAALVTACDEPLTAPPELVEEHAAPDHWLPSFRLEAAASATAVSAPTFLITPTGFDFGEIEVGTTSGQLATNVTNIGTTPIVLSMAGGAPSDPQFAGSQNCQGVTLNPGESCQISYTFSPTSAGPASTTSSFTVNGQSATVDLAGTGVGPSFNVSPTALDFATVQVGTTSGQQSTDITNTGVSPVTVSLATQAARLLGEPQHRLIYLCEKGVVVPDFQDAEGRGSSRRFSARNPIASRRWSPSSRNASSATSGAKDSLTSSMPPACSPGRARAASASTPPCASRPRTVPGSSVSSATVLAHPSRSNGCTRSTPAPPVPRPRAASFTVSPSLTSTAAPSCCSPLLSSSRPSRPTLRVGALVPPPRVHRHRYHGVLAPNARLRPHVVALGRPEAPAPEGDPTAPAIAAEPARERTSPSRIRWAVLLSRIYDVLPLLCPAGHRAKRGPAR